MVAGATVTLVNTVLRSEFKALSNEQGFYSFPALPVGHYDLTIEAPGFRTQTKTDLTIDTDAALRMDAMLALEQRSDIVTVEAGGAATEVQLDTVATHLGELVTGPQMTALPLNGRSYTDLLPIQPGVTPASTLLSNSVIMAGVTGGLSH
jgi:Carboxypeptidase regulatory-like domain